MKFLLVQGNGAPPQYVSVHEADVPDIAEAFARDDVLTVTDIRNGNVTHFNMANVVFLSVQDHKDSR